MHDLLDLGDLEPIQVPVRCGDRAYVLMEGDEAAVTAWRNIRMACTRVTPTGETYWTDGIANAQPALIAGCLYRGKWSDDKKEISLLVTKAGKPVKIDESEVRSLTHAHAKKLYEKALEITGLNSEDDTVESLEKQIEILQKRLEDLRKNGEPAKN